MKHPHPNTRSLLAEVRRLQRLRTSHPLRTPRLTSPAHGADAIAPQDERAIGTARDEASAQREPVGSAT